MRLIINHIKLVIHVIFLILEFHAKWIYIYNFLRKIKICLKMEYNHTEEYSSSSTNCLTVSQSRAKTRVNLKLSASIRRIPTVLAYLIKLLTLLLCTVLVNTLPNWPMGRRPFGRRVGYQQKNN